MSSKVQKPAPEEQKEEKLYVGWYKLKLLSQWKSFNLDDNSDFIPATKQRFIDVILQGELKYPESVVRVTREEMITDAYKHGGVRYRDMFGWDYADAFRCCMDYEGIFAYAVSEKFPRRYVGFLMCRDDQDFAFEFVKSLYGVSGGDVYIEEYNSDKHVKGYTPDYCLQDGYILKSSAPTPPPLPPSIDANDKPN